MFCSLYWSSLSEVFMVANYGLIVVAQDDVTYSTYNILILSLRFISELNKPATNLIAYHI